jgi:iron-regulated transporter 1
MSVQEAGLWRGISSAMGLFGTLMYHCSTKRTGVQTTGAWSIVWFFTCLTLACSSFIGLNMPKEENEGNSAWWSKTCIYLLVGSAALSRIGLWVFDMSVTMLYQELTPDGVRAMVGGTQESLNSFFSVASGCLGLIFRKPQEFWIVATAGYLCIGMAMLVYITGNILFHRRRNYKDLRSLPVSAV